MSDNELDEEVDETGEAEKPLSWRQKALAWSESKTDLKKVTGEEIEAQWEDRAEKKAEKKAAGVKRYSWLTVGNVVGVLALLGAVAFAYFGYQAQSRYESDFAFNEAVIAKAEEENQLLSAPYTESQEEEITATAAEALDAATVAAIAVADLQNQFQNVHIYTVAREGGGADLVGGEELDIITQGLSEYFLVDNSVISNGDWFPMETTEESGLSWATGKALTLTDTQKVRVVWEANETVTGDLLAWAVGEWDHEQGKFVTLLVGITSQGRDFMPGSDSGDLDGGEVVVEEEVVSDVEG